MNYLNPEKPIFIVGCPRSGTTVLATRLAMQPQIAVSPETTFFEIASRIPPFNIMDEPISESGVERLLNFQKILDLKLDVNRIKTRFAQSDKMQRSLFCLLMDEYRDLQQKTIWCEKSPQHLLYLDKIFNWFPKAKVIHIVRDGRDVASSLRKVPWRENNLSVQAHTWVEYAKRGIKADSSLPATVFHTVFYEDLIRSPREVLKGVFRFIDLGTEQIIFDGPGQEKSLGCLPAWEEEWKGKAKKPLDVQRISAWRLECSEEEIKLLNYIMGPLLRSWGYSDTEISCSSSELIIIQCRSFFGRLAKQPMDFLGKYTRFRKKKYLGSF